MENKDKLTICFLWGGQSSENQVSRNSAVSILREIDRDKYNILCVGITSRGEWLVTDASTDEIADGSWEDRKGNRRAILSPDTSTEGLISEDGEKIKVDLIWPVLHGKKGEDGTIQGLFELSGIKYVGCGVASSACCMDKVLTKILVSNLNVKQAKSYIAGKTDFEEDQDRIVSDTAKYFSGFWPLFVKPSSSGSSVGISKVGDLRELRNAYETAFKEDSKVIVEEAVVGQEVETAVLGNEVPLASSVGEILSSGDWYDYNSKYNNIRSKTIIPARIDDNTAEKIKKQALEIYKLLGCRNLARVDFFVRTNGEIIFNEINTLPGFTAVSMYPKLWLYDGITYSRLIDEIIKYAMEQ